MIGARAVDWVIQDIHANRFVVSSVECEYLSGTTERPVQIKKPVQPRLLLVFSELEESHRLVACGGNGMIDRVFINPRDPKEKEYPRTTGVGITMSDIIIKSFDKW